MNPDIIGRVWTDEFDLNTLRVDGKIFESGKKKLRIQKYPDTCGRGLNVLGWENGHAFVHRIREKDGAIPRKKKKNLIADTAS